jgi:hypothetical protein
LLLLVEIQNIILRMKVAEYVGGYHLGLQLPYQVLLNRWLLGVAYVLLTAREGALEPTFLIKAPLPALLAEGVLTA